MALVLKKEALAPWLGKIATSQQLVAPTEVDGKLLYTKVTSPEQVKLEYSNTLLSPKEWFFPQTDSMLRMNLDGADVVDLRETLDESPRVIFGIRPCDARAIVVLDKVFLSDPVDSYYEARRKNTTLVGLACIKPSVGCFCTSVGSAPDDSSNVDVMLTAIDDGYIVEALSEKGQALLKEATLAEQNLEKPAAPELAKLNTADLEKNFWGAFDADLWQKLSDRCLGCRACTYVCPTCYCFNVRDYESKDGEVSRLRGWDSCQGATFYKLAGGHNVRPTKVTRLRQRFYHKLLYIPDRFEITGCVGCGRCVVSCPVNVDIREVITKVVEHQEKASVESVSA